MNTIMIEVVCPSSSRTYDYKLPLRMKNENIKSRLIEDIRTFENLPELFSDESGISLYFNGVKLSGESTPEKSGLENGSVIVII